MPKANREDMLSRMELAKNYHDRGKTWYSQDSSIRSTISSDGTMIEDCSSFVSWVVTNSHVGWWTGNLADNLKNWGYKELEDTSVESVKRTNFKVGDVFIFHSDKTGNGHTAIVYKEGTGDSAILMHSTGGGTPIPGYFKTYAHPAGPGQFTTYTPAGRQQSGWWNHILKLQSGVALIKWDSKAT